MKSSINKSISNILNLFIQIGPLVLVVLTLFLFWSLTTEYYDTPKFIVLVVFLLILLVFSSIKYITEGKVTFHLTPLDLPLVVFLVVAAISTYFSSSQANSFYGIPPKFNGSLSTIIAYVLLYFVLVNNIKGFKAVKNIILTLTIGGALLSIFSLLSFLGIKILPQTWTQVNNFTPTGSSFSTAALLVILIPVLLVSIMRENTLTATKTISALLLALFGIIIVLIGSTSIYIAAIVAVALVILTSDTKIFNMAFSNKSTPFLAIPLVITVLTILAVIIPSFGQSPNPLYTQSQNFPREIQLDIVSSWKVSISAFRDSPFWGTGPATYLFDFTAYKPVEINSSKFWNIRFDQSYNQYLQILAELGGVGLLALCILTAIFISLAIKQIRVRTTNPEEDLNKSLAISGILFFVLLALHPASLVLMIVGIMIIASFITINHKSRELRIRFGDEGASLDLLPIILLIIVFVLTCFVSLNFGQVILADYYHRNAINSVNQNNGIDAYNQLVKAENLNLYNDLYRTDLSQTNFALANAIASSKGPTESSPSGSLTDNDKANIQKLLQQSITEGRVATSISPKNPADWEILASIYRQISGVAQNALSFSLDAYGRAIQLDPLNPSLRLDVGGIYYSMKNYDQAIRFFTDAITLKPDYANAYYNLSFALRDNGDLPNAQAAAEKVLSLVDPNSADYKLVNNYLSDLKNRISTGSAQQSQITAPAAEESSALQKKTLPKVLNVKNVSTPSAAEKPQSSPETTP